MLLLAVVRQIFTLSNSVPAQSHVAVTPRRAHLAMGVRVCVCVCAYVCVMLTDQQKNRSTQKIDQ